ncbi:MAG TPA: hypothetical protein VI451_00210, partial [Anaerolineales bacterium]|nr:hypothetical protein [Anaerolineales bacterium]
CEYSIPDRYQGYPGIAHGGIVAAILDEVFTKAHKRLLAMQIADILEEKQLTKSELANWTDLKTTTDFFLTYVTRRRCNLTPHPERLL